MARWLIDCAMQHNLTSQVLPNLIATHRKVNIQKLYQTHSRLDYSKSELHTSWNGKIVIIGY